ncbi:MAG: hypothetical protein ABW098_19935 [Candidatus Thiodiazotropha sp.]
MHKLIVKKISRKGVAAGDSLNQLANHKIEACLLPRQTQLLPTFPISDWSNSFSQYLVKRVRRNPRDLRAHVQRTLLYLSRRDTESIYAALIDLFLILRNRGWHIRNNLLTQAMPILQEEQYQFLKKHLESGLNTSDPLPAKTFSCLSRGHSGTTQIVIRKSTDANHSGASPHEQAMERYRQNDWLTAMVILENALHHDPGDEPVCRELLSLYKLQHAREAFYRTYAGLFGRRLALPDLWRDTERFFLDSTHLTNQDQTRST